MKDGKCEESKKQRGDDGVKRHNKTRHDDMKMAVTAEGALTTSLRRVNKRVTVIVTPASRVLTLTVTVETRGEGRQQRNAVEVSLLNLKLRVTTA